MWPSPQETADFLSEILNVLMKKLRKPLMKIFFVPCNSKMKSLKTKFKDS